MESPTTGVSWTVCDTCGKIYKDKRDLVDHLETHNGDEYCCDLCGNVFSSKRKIFKHVKSLPYTRAPRFTTIFWNKNSFYIQQHVYYKLCVNWIVTSSSQQNHIIIKVEISVKSPLFKMCTVLDTLSNIDNVDI